MSESWQADNQLAGKELAYMQTLGYHSWTFVEHILCIHLQYFPVSQTITQETSTNNNNIGLDERKPVFRVSDKGINQPARQQILLATHNYFIKITEYLFFFII